MLFSRLFPLLPVLLVLFVLASSAAATTIIPVSDSDLAVSVRSIVKGEVVSTECAWDPEDGAVFTYVTVDVTEAIKGEVPPGRVTLKQLGGQTATAMTFIAGAPRFEAGERVLLFLNTDAEGSLRVAHLSVGHFRIETDAETGEELVVRPETEAIVLPAQTGAVVTDRARLAGFVDQVRATLDERRDDAARSAAEYVGVPVLLSPPRFKPGLERAGADPAFAFLSPNMRWTEPSSGGSVSFSVNPDGAPIADVVDQAKNAFDAWSSVSNSSLRVVYSGRTSACGFKADGVSAVSFGDCLNQLDRPTNCSGVVAQGGISKGDLAQTSTVGGKRFSRALEGDVVFNTGFDCLLSNPLTLAEVMTHELGHALGFGHSSDASGETNTLLRDATMYYAVHADGRGASLHEDDQNAARFLYPGRGPALDLEMVTGALPSAVVGQAYRFSLRASGGSSPYSWSVVDGALPGGISLLADGTLTGTATAETTATVTLQVRDASGHDVKRGFSLRVSRQLAPFVKRAVYKDGAGKLVLSGENLSASATVTINGQTPTLRAQPRYNAARQRLTVRGSADSLRLREPGRNTVVLTIGGVSSNTATF